MNVLVIPEDFRKDQYMLKPLVEAMLDELGIHPAKVRVCQDPLLGGVEEALKWERIAGILAKYAWQVDLFLLCVDRDGKEGRYRQLQYLEQKALEKLPNNRLFFAENAWQEIEVWVLAGHEFMEGWNWQTIRAEVNPKETYYEPLARSRGLMETPGQGRKILAQEAARRFSRIRQLCREDICNLEAKIKQGVKK